MLKLKSKHKLLCGDSTDKADVDRLMDGAKADMVFTDPPYNITNVGQKTNNLPLKKFSNVSKSLVPIGSFNPEQFLETILVAKYI